MDQAYFELYVSDKKTKKYMAIDVDTEKKIYFGQHGASDFTIHKDISRKERYINRHEKNEDWSDLTKAGTWSRYILWNKRTIQESIRDMKKKFGIQIKNYT